MGSALVLRGCGALPSQCRFPPSCPGNSRFPPPTTHHSSQQPGTDLAGLRRAAQAEACKGHKRVLRGQGNTDTACGWRLTCQRILCGSASCTCGYGGRRLPCRSNLQSAGCSASAAEHRATCYHATQSNMHSTACRQTVAALPSSRGPVPEAARASSKSTQRQHTGLRVDPRPCNSSSSKSVCLPAGCCGSPLQGCPPR